jgi:hypothetical protein
VEFDPAQAQPDREPELNATRDVEPVAASNPSLAAVSREAAPKKRQKPKPKFSKAGGFGIAAAVACLIGGYAALVEKREAIVRTMPLTADLYRGLGLATNIRGLAIKSVTSSVMEDNAQRILVVTGVIENIRSSEAQIPNLRVAVRNDAALEIYHWESPAPKASLVGGESVVFRARLMAAPESGKDVKVQFAGIAQPANRETTLLPGK